MIWDGVFQTQLAEPSIGEVDLNLPANLPLRSNGEDIANDEHPDHQYWINRRPANPRVVGRKLRVDPGQVQDATYLPDEMIFWDHLVEAELVEKLLLVPLDPPHHGSPPPPIDPRRRNHRG